MTTVAGARVHERAGEGPLPRPSGPRLPQGGRVPPARAVPGGRVMRRLLRLVAGNRWPLYLSGLLAMAIAAYAVLIYVATRPSAPRPIPRYYEASAAVGRGRGGRGGEPAARLERPLRDPEGRAPRGGHAPPRRRAGGRPGGQGRRRPRGPPARGAALRPAPEPVGAARGPAPARPAATAPSWSSTSRARGSSASTRSRTGCASSTPPASTVAPDAPAAGGGPVSRPAEAATPRGSDRAARTAGSPFPPSRRRERGPAVLLRRLRAGLRPHPGVGLRPVLPLRRAARRARSSPRGSAGGTSRSSTTRGCWRSSPTRWRGGAAAPASTSRACTAPPACGWSRSCPRRFRASTPCA